MGAGQAVAAGSPTGGALLGLVAEGEYHDPKRLTGFLAQNPGRGQHLILAVIQGGIEGATERTVWRNPRPEYAAYFAQLAAWGYPLSEIERVVTDALEPKATPTRRAAAKQAIEEPAVK